MNCPSCDRENRPDASFCDACGGRLATAFGLYASALARGYDAKTPYQAAMPLEVYRRWCAFLAERRLTPKNVAREYITVERSEDGWQVDLADLESTVASLAPGYYAPYSFCLQLFCSASLIREYPEGQRWVRWNWHRRWRSLNLLSGS